MSDRAERVAKAMAVASGVRPERLARDWPLYAGMAEAAIRTVRLIEAEENPQLDSVAAFHRHTAMFP